MPGHAEHGAGDGIDSAKRLTNTPSGRTYTYVDPLSNDIIPTDELAEIYG